MFLKYIDVMTTYCGLLYLLNTVLESIEHTYLHSQFIARVS